MIAINWNFMNVGQKLNKVYYDRMDSDWRLLITGVLGAKNANLLGDKQIKMSRYFFTQMNLNVILGYCAREAKCQ